MEAVYLPPSEYQAFIKAIEERFGPYKYKPRVVITPNLYKKYGALGQTTFTKTADGTPVLIEIDADIWYNKPRLGRETLVHELLEWKFIEQGEEYPHHMSERYTPEIFGVASRTWLDVFLEEHPLIRRIVRGY